MNTKVAASTEARFNADGTLDTTFTENSNILLSALPILLTVQPDGKSLASAGDTIFRFKLNGSRDSSFANVSFRRGNQAAAPITAAVLPNGKILVGGTFTTAIDLITARSGFARLNADGTLDTGYGTNGGVEGGTVDRIVLQPDGKALISGMFQYVNHFSQPALARLNNEDAAVNNPTPTLTSISPTSVVAGSAAITMTVTGTGFCRAQSCD